MEPVSNTLHARPCPKRCANLAQFPPAATTHDITKNCPVQEPCNAGRCRSHALLPLAVGCWPWQPQGQPKSRLQPCPSRSTCPQMLRTAPRPAPPLRCCPARCRCNQQMGAGVVWSHLAQHAENSMRAPAAGQGMGPEGAEMPVLGQSELVPINRAFMNCSLVSTRWWRSTTMRCKRCISSINVDTTVAIGIGSGSGAGSAAGSSGSGAGSMTGVYGSPRRRAAAGRWRGARGISLWSGSEGWNL